MEEICHQMFYAKDLQEMLYWLNKPKVKSKIISITQAKDNSYNIFYWKVK